MMQRLFWRCHVESHRVRSLFLIILIVNVLSFFSIDTVTAQVGQTPLMDDCNTYSPQEVTSRLNAFFVQHKMSELKLEKVTKSTTSPPSHQPTFLILYKAKNCTLSLNTQILDGKEQVCRVTLKEAPETSEKLNDFVTCSMGLMSIFTPEMNAKVRGEVLSRMMGLKRDKDGRIHFASQNTYIIVDTKYSFTYTNGTGLQLEITQMPPLEPYEGVPQGL